jgi:hypothetical protein
MEILRSLNEMTSFILILFAGFIVWFFKSVYSDFKLVFDYYIKNKEADLHKILLDMEQIRSDLRMVESESKRYWSEQKERATSNHAIILEKLDNQNKLMNSSNEQIIKLLNQMTSRMDKFEQRIDQK